MCEFHTIPLKTNNFNSMKKWKFGIIGAGLIADFHAKAIESLENATLNGICGTNRDKAKKLAEKEDKKEKTDKSKQKGRAAKADERKPKRRAAKYGQKETKGP